MSEPAEDVDWMAQLDEPPAAAEVIKREEKDYFRDLQATLYEQAAKVVGDVLLFSELEPGAKEVPEEWIRKFGAEEARIKFNMATAGWMSQKSAPIGVTIAQRQVLGIMKAKATEEAAPRSLSVTLIQGGPMPTFPEKVIDETSQKKLY
jgi:hypothetical protein